MDPCSWDIIRKQLAEFARCPKRRINEWSPQMPCDWKPTQVESPSGLPFTHKSAWEFIADLLDSGHEFHEKKLEPPPGAIGYETVVQIAPKLPPLYIKIQLKGGRIWGRSFHYSYCTETEQ